MLGYLLENIRIQQKITISLLLINLIIGIFRYKKFNKPDHIFILVVIVALITELLSAYIRVILDQRNFICYNIYTIISFILYLWYYKNLQIKFPFYAMLFIFFVSVIASFLWEDFYDNLQSYMFLTGACVIVISIFYYFSDMLQKHQIENLLKNSAFLFSCGLLIFNLGIIPFFLLRKFLGFSNMFSRVFIIGLNSILYISYILAFLCSRRKTH